MYVVMCVLCLYVFVYERERESHSNLTRSVELFIAMDLDHFLYKGQVPLKLQFIQQLKSLLYVSAQHSTPP